MIAPPVVAEIRRLLAEGRLSRRKIALAAGVSHATVDAIASGRRPDYAPPAAFVPPSGPPIRCPGCGGLVQMPCLRCQLEGR